MKTKIHILLAAIVSACFMPHSVFAFEGRIHGVITQGGQTAALLYTVGTNFLRVEMTATNRPNPVDIVDRNSGALTLLFPANRSFVRLKPATENSSLPPGSSQMRGNPEMPSMPAGLPPGIGPQSQGAPAPAVPAMPMMPVEKLELKDTGEKTNLLGFASEKFEITQRGETMEIWATDQLIPFQPYVQNQPHRFGPRMMEERWGGLLAAKRLFPLRAVLLFDNNTEHFRFEVTSVKPGKLTDENAGLFQPPPGWFEIQPLPF